MKNLLKETMEKLEENNKSYSDVMWVGCTEFKTTWENFSKIADIEYDDGFGGAEVSEDLLIVGKDFWLERHEYDGSEWWEYKSIPIEPCEIKELKAITLRQAIKFGFNRYWSGGLKSYNGFE